MIKITEKVIKDHSQRSVIKCDLDQNSKITLRDLRLRS